MTHLHITPLHSYTQRIIHALRLHASQSDLYCYIFVPGALYGLVVDFIVFHYIHDILYCIFAYIYIFIHDATQHTALCDLIATIFSCTDGLPLSLRWSWLLLLNEFNAWCKENYMNWMKLKHLSFIKELWLPFFPYQCAKNQICMAYNSKNYYWWSGVHRYYQASSGGIPMHEAAGVQFSAHSGW